LIMSDKPDSVGGIELWQRRSDDCTPVLHRNYQLRNHPLMAFAENQEIVTDIPLVISQTSDKWQASVQPVISLAEENATEVFQTGLLKSRVMVKTINHDPMFKLDLGAYHSGLHTLTQLISQLPFRLHQYISPKIFIGGLVRFAYPEGYATPYAIQGNLCWKTRKFYDGMVQISAQKILGDTTGSQAQLLASYTFRVADSEIPDFVSQPSPTAPPDYIPFGTLSEMGYHSIRKFLSFMSWIFPIPKIPRGLRWKPFFFYQLA